MHGIQNWEGAQITIQIWATIFGNCLCNSLIIATLQFAVLATGLSRNFAHATVEVVDCPDLRRAPFHLAAEGLSSDSNAAGTLVDVGGPPYLLPHVDRTRIYDLRAVAQHLQPAGSDVLCIGAGAGYYPLYDTNCEGVYNMRVSGQTGRTEGSGTRFAVNVADGGGGAERCELRAVPAEETRSALLVNLFLCEGRPGKVGFTVLSVNHYQM